MVREDGERHGRELWISGRGDRGGRESRKEEVKGESQT